MPDDSLVTEVLVRSEGDQSLDHGGHSGLGLDFSLNLLQGVLELLDLDHGGVGECGQKSKGLVN